MANLSITAATVGMTSTAPGKRTVIYGEAVTEGQVVYLKTADGKYWVASNATEDPSAAAGIALTPGQADDRGEIATSGNINIGATLEVGTLYVLSTAGLMSTHSDILEDDWVTLIGWAVAADQLRIAIVQTGIQQAAIA